MSNNQGRNVLIFSLTYFPFVGGAEVAVKEITERIGSFNFDMVTARLDRRNAVFQKIGNVSVYRVGLGFWFDKYLYPFLSYFKARKLHKKRNYVIIQAIMASYAGLAALFFKWTHPSVRYLLTMQSGDSDFFIWLRTWFWYPLYKQIYVKADMIQAISVFLRKRARRYGYKGRVVIVPNGVDLDVFKRADQEEIDGLKKELGIGRQEKVIISVSRLVGKNGLDDLIRACAHVLFPFKLVIVGSGKEKFKLMRLTKKLSIDRKTMFLGCIPHKDMYKYLSISDVFVRLSRSEGFGNVFIEALACGVPVIGTNAGGSVMKIICKDKDNISCAAKAPESVAHKIKKIVFGDNTEHIQMGQRLIRKKYTWSVVGAKMKKVYTKITRER